MTRLTAHSSALSIRVVAVALLCFPACSRVGFELGAAADSKVSSVNDGTVDSAGDGAEDARVARTGCSSLSTTIDPVFRASFSTPGLDHVHVAPSVTVTRGGDSQAGVVVDSARMVGPCQGAWQFGAAGGHIVIDDAHPTSITLRAVVELPQEWADIRRGIVSKDVLGRGSGQFLVAATIDATKQTRLVLRIQDATSSYLVCSDVITQPVVELVAFVGGGQRAKLFWRPWRGGSWGPFSEARTSDGLTPLGTEPCGVVTEAATVDLRQNTNAIHVGRLGWWDTETSEPTQFNYTGWIAEMELYGQRLAEPP